MSTMNTVGRLTAPNQVQTKPATLTGGRGLLQNEALIFEGDGWGKTGVDEARKVLRAFLREKSPAGELPPPGQTNRPTGDGSDESCRGS